jgi:hypothetical protein
VIDSTETTRIVFSGTTVGMLVAGAEHIDAVRLRPILLTPAHQLKESPA